jgi:hypothetical protein
MKTMTAPWSFPNTGTSTFESDGSALQKGHVIRVARDRHSAKIVCRAGCVWMTQEDGEDRILHGGDSAMLDPRGLTVVEALEDSVVALA